MNKLLGLRLRLCRTYQENEELCQWPELHNMMIMMSNQDCPTSWRIRMKKHSEPLSWKPLTIIFRLISLLNQWSILKKRQNFKNFMILLQNILEKQQFQMSIPWKQVHPDLLKKGFAVRTCQEKVFAWYKEDEKVLMTKIFDLYLKKGYIRKLEEHKKWDIDAFYLPFFCVLKTDRETTPVRALWDCAAKFKHNRVKKSLNFKIELTPNHLQDPFKLLLRMWKHKNVILSDISEMFLKVILTQQTEVIINFTTMAKSVSGLSYCLATCHSSANHRR